jgi:type I protein arginine methyltransferase
MDSDSASSTNSDPLDTRDDEGYEDVEPDQEPVEVVGLFSGQVYPDAMSMLQDCKEKYSFDLIDTQKKLGVFSLSWNCVSPQVSTC